MQIFIFYNFFIFRNKKYEGKRDYKTEGGKYEGKREYNKDGDYKKPQFRNTREVQNKNTPLSGGQSEKYESKYEKPSYSEKRTYTDKENKEYKERLERSDQPRKFVSTPGGLLTKAAEENSKIKAPTKTYLEADVKNTYKEDEPEIEKPKFVNRNVGDTNEPHFKDINKNEDVKIIF